MKTWYELLQFSENPFSIKPGAIDCNLAGNDRLLKEVLKKVKTGKVCYVQGDYGFGKTTLLKQIKKEGEHATVAYYNCNSKEKQIDFEKLLSEVSFFHWVLNWKSKNVVLLLDEVHELGKRDCESLVEYYKKGYLKSIVLVSKSGDSKFTFNLRRLIGNNRFSMNHIDEETVIQVVRKRVGETCFTDDDIRRIFSRSGGNPRLVLRYCEDICKKAFEVNGGKIDETVINGAFGLESEVA